MSPHRLLWALAVCLGCGGAPPPRAQDAPGSSGALPSLATKQGYPISIVTDGSAIFWTNHLGGEVVAMSAGGAPRVLVADQKYPLGIAVDQTDVYWTTLNGGEINKISKAGGTPVVLAKDQFGPKGIALDGTTVYWTNTYGGTVMSVPKAGGSPTQLASKQAMPSGIAVSGGAVYWTSSGTAPDFADGAVHRYSQGAVAPIATELHNPQGIAADAQGVYWVEHGLPPKAGGGVMSAPLEGGAPRALVSGQAGGARDRGRRGECLLDQRGQRQRQLHRQGRRGAEAAGRPSTAPLWNLRG